MVFNRELDSFIDEFWSRSGQRFGKSDTDWEPACEVEEADDHYLLTLDMPGVPKDQIKIEVVDNQVLISGERRFEQRQKEGGAWYSERRFGRFQRRFALPAGVSSDKVEADYRDGVLSVYVPKADSAKPRQIQIGSGAGAGGFFSKLIGQSGAGGKDKGPGKAA